MKHLILLGLLFTAPGAILAAPARAGPDRAPDRAAGRAVVISLQDQVIEAAGIETKPIEKETGIGELVVPGVVTAPPQQLRVVAAPAAGLVETLSVALDEDVLAGAPIARLKSSELVEDQRVFLHAISDANLAAEKLRRDEQLFKERIIAERRLLVTRAENVQARSVLDERTQLLALDGMTQEEIDSLRHSRKMASALLVRAPMSGTIIARHGTAGERIQASSPLVTIARLDPIWVVLQIPIARAVALETVDRVTFPSVGVEGKLIRIGRTVDATTQSVTAVVEVKPGKIVIRPGQALQAILRLRVGVGAQWRVPADAVVHHDDSSWVFVRMSTGFRATSVTIVSETPQYASLRAALKPGDRVATRGILTLLAELAAANK